MDKSWLEAAVQFLTSGYLLFVVIYFIGVSLTYTILLVISVREILSQLRHDKFCDFRLTVQSELTPPVSILAPAFNEGPTIIQSVRSLLKLSYGKYETVVINDGSKDDTLAQMIEYFKMYRSKHVYRPIIHTKAVRAIYKSRLPEYRSLVVVDKENGGKADALNVGINAARYDFVCCIDADSILEDDALQKVMRAFLEDDKVVAVGGIVRIANGCDVVNGRVVRVGLSDRLVPIFQVVEYFRAFLSGRMSWQALNGLLIISGAFGLFKRDAVIKVGGYKHDSIGEDMELVMRLHRIHLEKNERYRVTFVPDPVCWTEAPDTLRVLSRQRNRWHRGLLDTMLIHRKMFLNRRYGVVGMAAMPYFVFVELLGPAFEFFGYVSMGIMIATGTLNEELSLLFFIVALFYGVMFSVGAVLLEEISFQRYPKPGDLALLLSFGVLENFGYRQLTAWWRVKAFWDYFRGKKSWGKMERKGFSKPAP
ncbi:MAG TPA: glycosyl transferase [Bacteroidetes bacterium]|nr:glycosyl transferase [Bacteroidota bacterium]